MLPFGTKYAGFPTKIMKNRILTICPIPTCNIVLNFFDVCVVMRYPCQASVQVYLDVCVLYYSVRCNNSNIAVCDH